jgi:hypothetical protein
MTEPIELYDNDGNIVIMYSPKVAEGLVEAGELLTNPPSPPEKQATKPGKKGE